MGDGTSPADGGLWGGGVRLLRLNSTAGVVPATPPARDEADPPPPPTPPAPAPTNSLVTLTVLMVLERTRRLEAGSRRTDSEYRFAIL